MGGFARRPMSCCCCCCRRIYAKHAPSSGPPQMRTYLRRGAAHPTLVGKRISFECQTQSLCSSFLPNAARLDRLKAKQEHGIADTFQLHFLPLSHRPDCMCTIDFLHDSLTRGRAHVGSSTRSFSLPRLAVNHVDCERFEWVTSTHLASPVTFSAQCTTAVRHTQH